MELRLWRREDALTRPVTAANLEHRRRVRLVVEVEDGMSTGFGEVSPLNEAAFFDPSLADVETSLIDVALPRITEMVRREGSLPAWSRMHLVASDRRADVWAFAALEMALLDLELVRAATPLEEFWSVDVSRVAGVETVSAIEFDPRWTPRDSTSRIRVKTAPGASVDVVAHRVEQWGRDVILDFNASADEVATVLDQVAVLAEHAHVAAVEQPFAPGDLVAHARLAEILDVPVSIDEGLRSLADLRRIERYRAASMVCVKTARVGGLAPARAILADCNATGMSAYVGGFFDSPLARRASRAVAAGFDVGPSDVADVSVHGDDVGTSRGIGIGFVPSLDNAVMLAAVTIP